VPKLYAKPGFLSDLDRWPTQAVLWLEWGCFTAGQSFPAALSRFLAVHSHSTVPAQPVANCRKLLHSQSAGAPGLALFETWESPPIDRIRPAHVHWGHSPHSYKVRSPAALVPQVRVRSLDPNLGWAGGPLKPFFGLSGAVSPNFSTN
jgi:hypothetical protein